MALTVYTPSESGVLPAMQEETRKTGIHTGRFLREQLAKQSAPDEPRRFPLAAERLKPVRSAAPDKPRRSYAWFTGGLKPQRSRWLIRTKPAGG